MAKILPIPDWAAPTLQGLAYWLGSQHELRLAANISEGAIAWELMRQVFTHRIVGRHLEAEVFYRHIPELSQNGELRGSRERADLIIAKVERINRTVSYAIGDVEAVIEIKHSRSRKELVWEDIDFLSKQRAKHPELRAFLIYASLNERPADFTDEKGAGITSKTQSTPSGSRYRVRRVCRATKMIPSNNKRAVGHYAVLIEVAPPPTGQAKNDA
jgi:hypothetical protein